MARTFTPLTLQILDDLNHRPDAASKDLYKKFQTKCSYKEFYNTLFRLAQLELVAKEKTEDGLLISLTEEGKKILLRNQPEREDVWKLVIFDIPEKQKYVRTILRSKLKSLHFKKWQNSIWISPYKLDDEIEQELAVMAKKYFIRLIKTTDINETSDLEKLFAE